MAKEIERKFLVKSDAWRAYATRSIAIEQGYLSRQVDCTVRVRTWGEMAYLTVKGKTQGATRLEYEYEIPVDEAREMLRELAQGEPLRKTRFLVPADGGLIWEIDVFEGAHRGLVTAEIELPDEAQPFVRPDWLGEDVTGDPRYFNSNL